MADTPQQMAERLESGNEWMGKMDVHTGRTLEELLFSRRSVYVEYAKQVVRRIARMALREGDLVPQFCEVCGGNKVEMHHDDYTKPLAVRWLCRKDHFAVHGWKVAS